MTSELDSKLERLSSSKVFTIAVLIFWAIVLTVGGMWLWQYRNQTVIHTEQLRAVEADCKGKGGDYGLYYDNGSGELPKCREPATVEERQALQERRSYREGLRSGNIDQEIGDPSGLNEYPY